MTCSMTRPARCRMCWAYYLALGVWLELRGYRRGCHGTFSRDAKYVLRRLLGPHGHWTAAALGVWFGLHLHRLQDLVETAQES